MVRLWDVKTGRLTATWGGHTGHVVDVAFSPDGRTVASCSHDATVRLWDVGTGRNTATLHGHTESSYHTAFSPDGKTLASTGFHDRTVRLWDVATGENKTVLHWHKSLPGWEQSDVYPVAFSPDARHVAAGGQDGTIMVWQADGQPVLGR